MAMETTLSVRDVQRCFEKERRALLCDLESLRQQLLKKEQSAQKAAAIASQQAVQLKKEIAALQAALTTSERERAASQEQYEHVSARLEGAMDQHQEDQQKIAQLSESLRNMEKKHAESVAVVRKEATTSVRNTHEERKTLRARVEQLQCKLETERKQWQTLQRPLNDQVDKSKLRLSILEKELQESRYREHASVQLKDKMQSEVVQIKRKVADLSTSLQLALQAKSEMKAEHQLLTNSMKDKCREILRSHQLGKEQLEMLQEDYNGLFRSRQSIVEQCEQIAQSIRHMKARHEQVLKAKDNEYWEMEKKMKRASVPCPQCLKTSEQRQEEMERRLDAAREQTRLAVAKDMEIARWDRFQDVNDKYIEVCREMQRAVEENAQHQKTILTMKQGHAELLAKRRQLEEDLENAERQLEESQTKQDEVNRYAAEKEKQVHELMDSLSNLTSVTSDQSKQLQALEAARREEVEQLKQDLDALDAEKQAVALARDALQQQHDATLEQLELLKHEKTQQWNESVNAQLSANLLIEEQAHTIDHLLKTKTSPSPPRSARRQSRLQDSASESQVCASDISQNTDNPSCDRVTALQQQVELLQQELVSTRLSFENEHATLRCDSEKKVEDILCQVDGWQRQCKRLERKLQEQATTIHELTMQGDSNSDSDEEDDSDALGTTAPTHQVESTRFHRQDRVASIQDQPRRSIRVAATTASALDMKRPSRTYRPSEDPAAISMAAASSTSSV